MDSIQALKTDDTQKRHTKIPPFGHHISQCFHNIYVRMTLVESFLWCSPCMHRTIFATLCINSDKNSRFRSSSSYSVIAILSNRRINPISALLEQTGASDLYRHDGIYSTFLQYDSIILSRIWAILVQQWLFLEVC